MNLVIDLGNTVAKLAVFEKDELREKEIVASEEIQEKISQHLLKNPWVKKVISSNVSKLQIKVPQEKELQILELSAESLLPFENLYATPQTLGNDRKALVAAAAKYYPKRNVLIIDAGTCITYDFKNSKNEYLGGAISPGLKMRFKALNSFTANLPLVDQQEQLKLVGNSTLTSINSGVAYGMVKEIDGFIEEYAAQYDDLLTIVTGGDAHFLSVNLKNSIFANSNFLLEGLNYILEFNTSQ
jgi:type III pantothenate kinase